MKHLLGQASFGPLHYETTFENLARVRRICPNLQHSFEDISTSNFPPSYLKRSLQGNDKCGEVTRLQVGVVRICLTALGASQWLTIMGGMVSGADVGKVVFHIL